MTQIIHPGFGAAEKIFHGSLEVTKIYHGTTLVWERDAAGKPVISSFTAGPVTNGRITLTFAVTGTGVRNRISYLGRNIPLESNTEAVVNDPGIGSHK